MLRPAAVLFYVIERGDTLRRARQGQPERGPARLPRPRLLPDRSRPGGSRPASSRTTRRARSPSRTCSATDDDEKSPGAIVFERGGKTYRLDPVLERGETDYFVIFGDRTNGRTPTAAGRFLYVAPPVGRQDRHRFQQGLQPALRLHRLTRPARCRRRRTGCRSGSRRGRRSTRTRVPRRRDR